mmetsp:Transcript_78381/g.179335  ORF Transcript_78381/g.179335 Transcript_78381/m.179335 type:complete len:459 (-) Transcript_78381:626-2002(-)
MEHLQAIWPMVALRVLMGAVRVEDIIEEGGHAVVLLDGDNHLAVGPQQDSKHKIQHQHDHHEHRHCQVHQIKQIRRPRRVPHGPGEHLRLSPECLREGVVPLHAVPESPDGKGRKKALDGEEVHGEVQQISHAVLQGARQQGQPGVQQEMQGETNEHHQGDEEPKILHLQQDLVVLDNSFVGIEVLALLVGGEGRQQVVLHVGRAQLHRDVSNHVDGAAEGDQTIPGLAQFSAVSRVGGETHDSVCQGKEDHHTAQHEPQSAGLGGGTHFDRSLQLASLANVKRDLNQGDDICVVLTLWRNHEQSKIQGAGLHGPPCAPAIFAPIGPGNTEIPLGPPLAQGTILRVGVGAVVPHGMVRLRQGVRTPLISKAARRGARGKITLVLTKRALTHHRRLGVVHTRDELVEDLVSSEVDCIHLTPFCELFVRGPWAPAFVLEGLLLLTPVHAEQGILRIGQVD